MLKISSITILTIATLFFSACSSSTKVFEPTDIDGSWKSSTISNGKIIEANGEVAQLEDGTVLAKNSTIDVDIKNGYRVLSTNDGWVISSLNGTLELVNIENTTIKKEFNLKKTIATANVQNDVLAVLFADNEIALYSIFTKELLLKEQGEAPIAIDSRIIKPYFMNDLVIFSTLDGKIVIVNSTTKKKLRTVIVSTQDNFNNIIYFNIINNKIIAATSKKILSLSSKEKREKYDIRNVAYNNGSIYLATKEGKVISLTTDLQFKAELKFPFAHFIGLIATGDKVYLLEKQGYIIETDSELSEYSIYSTDVEEGYVYVGDKAFYVDKESISVE